MRLRIASSTANPLCPSFRCRTPGVMPMALRARKPPTPSSSSWRIRTRPSPPYNREVSSRSSGAFPSTFESSSNRSQRPTFIAPHLRANGAAARLDLHRDRLALGPDGRLHGQLVDVGRQIFFLLPAVAVQPLAEISLAVKQADADQRNTQVGRALDVIAGQHAESAGINGNRLVQAEFGGEIRDRTRPQNARVPRSPGAVRLEIFPLAAVGVIDSAVQHQFPRAPLNRRQRHLPQQRDGIVVELPPAYRIEIAEQAGGVVIPAPPQGCAPATRAAPEWER